MRELLSFDFRNQRDTQRKLCYIALRGVVRDLLLVVDNDVYYEDMFK
jgi:hypothetical protein